MRAYSGLAQDEKREEQSQRPHEVKCTFQINGTCHAGSIVRDNYACGAGCGLCAPLGKSCVRPCGAWTLKFRGAGGKFVRENILLSLLEQRAVSQSEGETLGNRATARRLAETNQRGGATIAVLRHPIIRILSRYWFEGRWDQKSSTPRTDDNARSLETWLEKVRKAPHGTRVWSCISNYYVKTLAGCGGPGSGCRVEDDGVGSKELTRAKLVLEANFSLVLLTEWLSSEGQGALMADALCFAWPRPLQSVPRGTAAGLLRHVPEFTPKRYSGTGIPDGWATTVNPLTIQALRRDNALDLELFSWAADFVRRRVRALAGEIAVSNLPLLAPV